MSTLIATTAQIGTIKDAGGNNTAMTIDTTGRISTPARPSFHARESAAGGGSGATGIIVFNVADFDIGSNYNTSNGRFTAPVAGIYQFCFDALVTTDTSGNALGDGENTYVCFYKNGAEGVWSQRSYHRVDGATQYNTITRMDCIQLNANDYVQVYVGNQYIYRDATNQYDATFQGFLLG